MPRIVRQRPCHDAGPAAERLELLCYARDASYRRDHTRDLQVSCCHPLKPSSASRSRRARTTKPLRNTVLLSLRSHYQQLWSKGRIRTGNTGGAAAKSELLAGAKASTSSQAGVQETPFAIPTVCLHRQTERVASSGKVHLLHRPTTREQTHATQARRERANARPWGY